MLQAPARSTPSVLTPALVASGNSSSCADQNISEDTACPNFPV